MRKRTPNQRRHRKAKRKFRKLKKAAFKIYLETLSERIRMVIRGGRNFGKKEDIDKAVRVLSRVASLSGRKLALEMNRFMKDTTNTFSKMKIPVMIQRVNCPEKFESDVEYFKKRLFSSCGIPKELLGPKRSYSNCDGGVEDEK